MLQHHHDYSEFAASPRNRRALKIALVINVAFLVAEVIGGFMFNSVALLSDAAHMLTDVGALALGLLAATLATRTATSARTYGWGRAEILAALVNATTLILASVWIIYEATMRMIHPEPVAGGGVMLIATAGLFANVAATWVLTKADRENINIRAAMAHSLMDAVSSVGVLIAGGVVLATGFDKADPIASYLIAFLSIYGTMYIFKESVNILLDATPKGIDTDAVAQCLLEHPAVVGVSDLHLWTLGAGRHAISAHVGTVDGADPKQVIHELSEAIAARHGVRHSTLQVACGPVSDTGCGPVYAHRQARPLHAH